MNNNFNPLGNLFQMFNSMKAMGNPNAIINQMMNNNPQMTALQNQIKNSGMTPKDFLSQYIKQNNIPKQQIDQILNMFNIKL